MAASVSQLLQPDSARAEAFELRLAMPTSLEEARAAERRGERVTDRLPGSAPAFRKIADNGCVETAWCNVQHRMFPYGKVFPIAIGTLIDEWLSVLKFHSIVKNSYSSLAKRIPLQQSFHVLEHNQMQATTGVM